MSDSSSVSVNTVSASSCVLIGSQAVITPSRCRPVTITPVSASCLNPPRVQSLPLHTATANRGHSRPVTITPVPAARLNPPRVPIRAAGPSPPLIKKILLKAVTNGKGKSKEFKFFTLRNINPDNIITCKDLVNLIRTQFSQDIINGPFDVGFIQTNSAVSIRSSDDLLEIWEQAKKGKSVTLWCDGMIPDGLKHPAPADSDEDTDQKKNKKEKNDTDREDRTAETILKLKAKHGAAFTQMQYRVWSEMIVGGVHSSQDDPPSTTMFSRCGTMGTKRKSTSDIVVQAIDKLSNALSPKSSMSTCTASNSNGVSPAKVIDNRSKCYKQLTELNNLKMSGVLTEEEYVTEKEVLASLKSLKK